MQMAMIVLLTFQLIPLPICSEAFCKRYNYRFDKSKGDETMTTILQLSDLHIGPQ